MLLEARVAHNVTEGVLHRHTVGAHHAVGVDVDDVDVVEGVDEVGARDDLPGFVEGDFGEGELGRAGGVSWLGFDFAVDKGAGEDDGCGLHFVLDFFNLSSRADQVQGGFEYVRRISAAPRRHRPSCRPRSNTGSRTTTSRGG